MNKLDAIHSDNQTIKGQLNKIMADLTNITTAVARVETVAGSVIALLQRLSAEITAAGTDPVALKALTDRLNAQEDAIAAAVVANTPAA